MAADHSDETSSRRMMGLTTMDESLTTFGGAGARAIGLARTAVGVAMIVAPRLVVRPQDGVPVSGTVVFMIRTIGVRDLALGLGTVVAAQSGKRDEARRWVRFGLVSDALDTIIGTRSAPLLGRSGAAIAALVPVPFVAADVWALRTTR
jgi:hypothetical protein